MNPLTIRVAIDVGSIRHRVVARVGRNNQRALRRVSSCAILYPRLVTVAPGAQSQKSKVNYL